MNMTSSPPQHLHGNDAQAKAQGVRLELSSPNSISSGGSVSSRLDRLDEWMILGDKIKLGQVMRNLISNALKFTPKGGVVAVAAVEMTRWSRRTSMSRNRRESVGVCPPTHWMTISVTDSGAGISKVRYR